MSISPSASFSPSSLCSRSASQAPPVYSPIIAVFGPMRGRSSPASCSHSASASGSFVKVLLQDELRGDRVDAGLLYAAHAPFRFDRAEALVDASDGEAEAAFQLAREALDAPGERMLAVRGDRQADHQLRRLPFRD